MVTILIIRMLKMSLQNCVECYHGSKVGNAGKATQSKPYYLSKGFNCYKINLLLVRLLQYNTKGIISASLLHIDLPWNWFDSISGEKFLRVIGVSLKAGRFKRQVEFKPRVALYGRRRKNVLMFESVRSSHVQGSWRLKAAAQASFSRHRFETGLVAN